MSQNLYEPLQPGQFRLVTIQPGAEGTPIHLTLFTSFLKSKPKYEALSYQCGKKNPDTDPVIYITSHTSLAPQSIQPHCVQVYQNLWMFLKRLRAATNERRDVWVDALSINQDSPTEKAEQIQMFGEIYRGAKKILGWLGEHDQGSELLFEDDWVNRARSGGRMRPGRGTAQWVVTHRKWWQSSDVKQKREDAWRALLKRPYFNRTWIVQEVLLARSLVFWCGPDHLNGDLIFENPLIERFGKLIRKKDNNLDIPRAFLLFFARANQKRHGLFSRGTAYYNDLNIFQITYHYQYTICRDRVDHVYALLALLPPAESSRIIPDPNTDATLLFVKICEAQLARAVKTTSKVTGDALLFVAMLYKGLRLDKRPKTYNDLDEDDNSDEADSSHAERILDLLVENTFPRPSNQRSPLPQVTSFVLASIVQTLDIYGFLQPDRKYLITQSTDSFDVIREKITVWRAQQQTQGNWYSLNERGSPPPRHRQTSDKNVFCELPEPLWGRYDQFQHQQQRSSAASQQAANTNNMIIMQNNLAMNQAVLMNTAMINPVVMTNPAMMGGAGFGGGGA